MTLLCICEPDIAEVVSGIAAEFTALHPDLPPLTATEPLSFAAAEDWISGAPPPVVALLDPELGGSRHSARNVRNFLDRHCGEGGMPAIILLRCTPSEFEIDALRNPRVWTWSIEARADAEERLLAVLGACCRPGAPRHFCATVTFIDRDRATLTVTENGVAQLQSRPLLKRAEDRASLNALAAEDLEPPRGGDFRAVWRRYRMNGHLTFSTLFGSELGDALISAQPNDTLELRFEMAPDQIEHRHGLPLELMSRAIGDDHLGFACTLRPMARRVALVRRDPTGVDKPRLLFIEAPTKGEIEVLNTSGNKVKQRLDDIADSITDQWARLDTLEKRGLLALETLTPENFGQRGATTFRNALEARLRDERKELPRIDILHFAGHGITQRPRDTQLVLPSRVGHETLELRELAQWLPDSVREVFLAACQTASVAAADYLHRQRRCSVLGFRWAVVAKRIPDFVEAFYTAHLRGQPVAVAYRIACERAQLNTDPAFVSAVALAAD